MVSRAYGSSPAPRTQPSPSEVDPQEIAEMAEKPGVLDTKENLQCLAKVILICKQLNNQNHPEMWISTLPNRLTPLFSYALSIVVI